MAGLLTIIQLSATSTPTADLLLLKEEAVFALPAETAEALTLPELIEKRSRDYGLDPESALAVAKCESQFRHYDKRGQVLRGELNRYDVGIFQINERYHLAKSQELGLDIYTPDGNIEYAVWLMSVYGRTPWVPSRHCWHRNV